MAGHSKWANIKHKKAAQDSKRGKIFTRLSKEITVATKMGGGNVDFNNRLRMLIEKAKEANMPADNIKRAIARGTGELPGVNYEEIMYEGYGPHGIAVILDVLTDNKNRTVADLRKLFSKNDGSLAESGAVSWMFKKSGIIRISAPELTEDNLIEQLLDFDIEDISLHEGIFIISCPPKSLEGIKQALMDVQDGIRSAEVEWVAHTTTTASAQQEEKIFAFLSELQDHDDVQDVYTNLL